MTLAEDFEDFIRLLNQHKVEYLVVGGYALAFHGTPRHTGDLDIWIGISDENAGKMLNVVKDFGLGSLGFKKSDFLKEGYVSQIGYPPLRIDILNNIDGVDFADAFQNKQTVQLDSNLSVDYIGLSELIQNKQNTGRARDLADVKEIRAKIEESKKPKRRKGPRL